jgi:hypothetical protein
MGDGTHMCRRRVAIAAMIPLCVVVMNGAWSDSRSAYSASIYGDLHGTVSVCERHFGKCIRVSTTVAVFVIKGHRYLGPVDRQRAEGGKFSFRLAPGTYLPTAPRVEAQLNDGRCISGEAKVRANADVNDSIICHSGDSAK